MCKDHTGTTSVAIQAATLGFINGDNGEEMETTAICWGYYNLKENGNYYNMLGFL